MDFKDVPVSTIIMMMLMMIMIILSIVIIIKVYKSSEKFGALERRRILSQSSLGNTATDETEEDLESEGASIAQELSKKEGYVMSRNNMLFGGQFDYLLPGKKDKPSFRKSDKSIVEEIGDNVKEKVQEISEQVSNSNIAVDSSVPTELVKEEDNINQEQTYETTNQDVGISNNDDVVSNSGNSVETSIPESFGYQRLNNDFSILQQSSKASEIAQVDDPSNQQTSTDMLSYIKNMMLNK